MSCQVESETLLLILSSSGAVWPMQQLCASWGHRHMSGVPMPLSGRRLRKVPLTQACAIRNNTHAIDHVNQEALSGLTFRSSII